MIIEEKISEKLRSKRGRMNLTKSAVAKKLNISRSTLAKVEMGNYDAPRRIYESVMNWLLEDL